MSVQLNHTIVWCRDKHKSSQFLTNILGLPQAGSFERFMVVELSNGVSLDFAEVERKTAMQHYAFLIDEAEFDPIFARIRESGVGYWADPAKTSPGAINHHDGGRGVYFEDPDGNLLEILTRPYGG